MNLVSDAHSLKASRGYGPLVPCRELGQRRPSCPWGTCPCSQRARLCPGRERPPANLITPGWVPELERETKEETHSRLPARLRNTGERYVENREYERRRCEDSHSYPYAVKLLEIMALAALRMVSSLMPQPKWFQVFQPIWGVNARPLLRARTAGSAATRANKERDMVKEFRRPGVSGRRAEGPSRTLYAPVFCAASEWRRRRAEDHGTWKRTGGRRVSARGQMTGVGVPNVTVPESSADHKAAWQGSRDRGADARGPLHMARPSSWPWPWRRRLPFIGTAQMRRAKRGQGRPAASSLDHHHAHPPPAFF